MLDLGDVLYEFSLALPQLWRKIFSMEHHPFSLELGYIVRKSHLILRHANACLELKQRHTRSPILLANTANIQSAFRPVIPTVSEHNSPVYVEPADAWEPICEDNNLNNAENRKPRVCRVQNSKKSY